ncbi:MAG: hypothetical protein HYY15_03750 [Candidatus Omnitrophica bacterium]|nr:hypothetical protein [Candidatus Omnitrophota bacterium]
MNGPHLRAHRVIASLNREQVDALDKVGKDALFSAGVKLSRTHIISVLVNVLQRLHVSGNGVRTPDELEQRILGRVTKGRGGKPHG